MLLDLWTIPGMVWGSSSPGYAPSYSAGHKGLRTVTGEQLLPNEQIMYRYSTRLIKKKSYHKLKSMCIYGMPAVP